MTGLVLTDDNYVSYFNQYLETEEGKAKVKAILGSYLDSSLPGEGKKKVEAIFNNRLDNEKQQMAIEAKHVSEMTIDDKINFTLEYVKNSGIVDKDSVNFNPELLASYVNDYAPSLLHKFFYIDENPERTQVILDIEEKYGKFAQLKKSQIREFAYEKGIEYPKWIEVHRVKRGTFRIPVLISERFARSYIFDDYSVNMAGSDCGDLNDQLKGMSDRILQNARNIKSNYKFHELIGLNDLVNPFTVINGIFKAIYAAAKDAVIRLFDMLADLLDPKLWEYLMYQILMQIMETLEGIIDSLIGFIQDVVNLPETVANAAIDTANDAITGVNSTISSLTKSVSFLSKQSKLHKCKTSSFTMEK